MNGETRGRKVKKWRPFEEAREWIRNLNLKNYREYRRYLRGEFPELPKIPDDIPKTPGVIIQYVEDWKGYSDWIGSPSARSTAFQGTNTHGYRKVIRLPLKLEVMIAEDACENLRSATKQIEFILNKHYENKGEN